MSRYHIQKVYSGPTGASYRYIVDGQPIGNAVRGSDGRWFAARVRDGRDQVGPYRFERSEALQDLEIGDLTMKEVWA